MTRRFIYLQMITNVQIVRARTELPVLIFTEVIAVIVNLDLLATNAKQVRNETLWQRHGRQH